MRVDALLRYPVKSMLGEQLSASQVGKQGLLGDRGYALVDQESGKVASAKHPRLWGVLFECHAAYIDEPTVGSALPAVRITLPNGDRVHSEDEAVHQSLSELVGRRVRLESRPPESSVIEVLSPEAPDAPVADEEIALIAPGTFFDAAPLHLVSTETLARLQDLEPASRFPAERFRPNIVITADAEPGFVDNLWVNRTLQLGTEVAAAVLLAAPRCVMTTLAQPDLPRDPGVLQAVARHNRVDIPGLGPRACVGVYAVITTGGAVHEGDEVEVV